MHLAGVHLSGYYCIWGRLGRPGLKVVTKGTLLEFLDFVRLFKLSDLLICLILSKAASMILGLYCRFKRYCRSSLSLLVRKKSVEQIRRRRNAKLNGRLFFV